jgi:hypothetical protein
MNNGVLLDVTQWGACKNQRLGGICASFIRVIRIGELGTRLLVTASVVPSSPILVNLMKEALRTDDSEEFAPPSSG